MATSKEPEIGVSTINPARPAKKLRLDIVCELLNYCSHTLHLYDDGNELIQEIESSGEIRGTPNNISQQHKSVNGIPFKEFMGHTIDKDTLPKDLPPHVGIVVSDIAAKLIMQMSDETFKECFPLVRSKRNLMIFVPNCDPGNVLRNSKKQIIGTRGFYRYDTEGIRFSAFN